MVASPPNRPRKRAVLARGGYAEALRIGAILRKETVGGALLVAAAAVAILWANSPASASYFALRDLSFGYAPWQLELTLGQWSADGLLAIFFFLVGLELKREFVAGDLRSPSKAIVPVAAAAGGVLVPALIYLWITWGDPAAMRGWAIPTATDIAFAVAVLAVIGSHLPGALRLFLLTLAVVDDLIAIVIIAFFYTSDLNPMALALTVVPLALYTFLAQKYRKFFRLNAPAAWIILLPIGVLAWVLLHASGIHPTVAGVLLGFAVPVLRAGGESGPGLAEIFEHRFRPISTGVAVPIFAFFSAGVALGGPDGLGDALRSPVTLGVIAALVLGKPIGIVTTTFLMTKLTRAELDSAVKWIDLTGVAFLGGIGFTVSLLVAELSFGQGRHHDEAKVAVIVASLAAAFLASLVLRFRNRQYRILEAEEAVDLNRDGIPDVYQKE
ncbi:MAG TPA: Na+/H+ antiporter NhaA [Microbacteriaceae bacterium]